MRTPRLLLVLIALAAFASSGCITVTNVIKLKPSGSGTLEMDILMNTEVFKQLGSMLGGEVETEGKSSMPSADDLAKEVSKMKGVRLVSQTAVKQGPLEGVKVLLAFDDVNQVSVSENLPGKQAKRDPKDEVKFSLARQPGGTSLLTIDFPDKPAETVARGGDAKPSSKPAEKPSPEMLKMLSGFFKGMRVMIALDVDGTLVRTSSPYVEGNRVTLLDFDMEQLLSDPAALDKMGALPLGPDISMTQAREAMAKAGVKGIKINDPRVTVEMR